MTKKFSTLRNAISEQAQADVAGQIGAIMAEMPLHELRRARGLSQKMLAENLRVQQPAIAKLEQRTDMYISTLRSHIEAMGGELQITACFPEGTVKISNFSQLEPAIL
ncbi:MAG: helix-turn-helix domain-containing protein [Deltaproteobacteria bacterium]|nr:helix-turn-helix domain-containing protein [Deltaproteobacteria bacterium]